VKNNKKALATVPIGVILLFTSIATPAAMMAYSEELGGVSEFIADDINRISDANTAESTHIHSTKPIELEYVKNNKSSKLANEGAQLIWSNRQDLGNYIDIDYEGQAIDNLKQEVEQDIRGLETTLFRCRSDSGEASIDFAETPYLSGEMVTDEVTTHCSYSSGDLEFTESDVLTEFETRNRYPELVFETRVFFEELEEELDQVESQENEERNCGSYPSRSSVEEEPAEDLEDAVLEGISNAQSNVPNVPGFEIQEAESVSEDTFDYGYASDILEATSTSERRSGSCCSNCGEDDEGSPDDWKYTEVTVTPEEVDILWELADEQYSIFTSGNPENLVFKVEPYNYRFQ